MSEKTAAKPVKVASKEHVELAKKLLKEHGGVKSRVMKAMFTEYGIERADIARSLTEALGQPIRYQFVNNVVKGLTLGQTKTVKVEADPKLQSQARG